MCEQGRRHEWPCPGDLLHIDSKRFARFSSPGHAVSGDRFRTGAEKRLRVGHEFVHSLVDDHSRLAYSERHRDQRASTVTGFVERGLAFYARHVSDTMGPVLADPSLRSLGVPRKATPPGVST